MIWARWAGVIGVPMKCEIARIFVVGTGGSGFGAEAPPSGVIGFFMAVAPHSVTGTITAADIVGPAAQGILAAPNGRFADVLRDPYRQWNFPTGEIRGQIRTDDDWRGEAARLLGLEA